MKVKLKKEKLTEFDAPIAKHMETSLVVASFMTIKMIYILSFGLLRMNIKVIFFRENNGTLHKETDRVKTGKSSTRKFSFQFFFYRGEEKVQACRQFYLRTLNISAKRNEYYYRHRINQETGTPLPLHHGKHDKKRNLSDARRL